MYKNHCLNFGTLTVITVIISLLVATTATPDLALAGRTTSSEQDSVGGTVSGDPHAKNLHEKFFVTSEQQWQNTRKLLRDTANDAAAAPSAASALAPVILAFMGINDNSTEAATNETAGSLGRGDGPGDGNRPWPPYDYCGSIHCPKYPNAVPVEGEVAAASDGAAASGNAVNKGASEQQQGAEELSVEELEGAPEDP